MNKLITKDWFNYGFETHGPGTAIICDVKKVCLIAVPKNGLHYFYHNCFDAPRNSMNDPAEIKRVKDAGYIIITSIRQPIDRFVSAYFEVCKLRTDSADHEILKQFEFAKKDILSVIKYRQFIQEIGGSFVNAHLMSQAVLIDPFLKDIDFIFNFDTLKKDTKIFNKKYPGHALNKNFRIINFCKYKKMQKILIGLSHRDKKIYDYIHYKYIEDFKLYNNLIGAKHVNK